MNNIDNTFSSNFAQVQRKKGLVQTVRIYSILKQKELLEIPQIYNLITKIKEALADTITTEDFTNIYLKFIANYAVFVQSLPSLKFSAFTKVQGHLEMSLNRAYFMLDFCSHGKIPIPPKANGIPTDLHKAIWQFAVFSAAMLVDVGQLVDRFTIDICDKSYESLQTWDPLGGAMKLYDASHYSIRYISETPNHELAKHLNVMLAKQIVPDYSLTWMLQDEAIFEEWLGFLHGDIIGTGEISKAIWQVIRRIAKQIGYILPGDISEKLHYLDALVQDLENLGIEPQKSQVDDLLNEYIDPDKLTSGKAAGSFLRWVRSGIKANTISINKSDSSIHMLANGVLLTTPGLLNAYVKKHPFIGSWDKIERFLQNIGVIPAKSANPMYAQAFLIKPKEQGRALIIKNSHIIFDKSKMPAVSKQIKNQHGLVEASAMKNIYPVVKMISKKPALDVTKSSKS